ncbi:TPA: ribonuclease HII, partial [Burkholderia cenocepacia]
MTAVRAPRRRAPSDGQGGFDFSRPDEIVCGV